jgi:hypothetical protein
MKLQINILFSILIVCLVSCTKSPKIGSDQQNSFVKFFGGSTLDVGSGVVQCPDGGFAITGTILTPGNSTQAFLIRTDINGNEYPWSPLYIGYTLNTSLNTKGYHILLTSDGNFLITGSVQVSSNNNDVLVTKISSAGNIIWSYKFGGSGNDEGYCSLEYPNGNYIIGGYTESSPYNIFGGKDELILNLDVHGNILGQPNTYGSSKDDWCNQILKFGNNLLLIGTTYGYQLSDTIPNMDLILISTSGTKLGVTNYGGLIKTTGKKGVMLNDSSIIIMGNQDSTRIYMVNISGNVYNAVWKKNIQSTYNELGNDILNYNEQLIIMGSIQATAYKNFLIQPLDSAGNLIPAVTTNTNASQIINSGIVSSDSHLVFTGQNIVAGVSQIVLVKTNLP